MGDDVNSLEILEKIEQCISIAGGSVGSSISVGFYEAGSLKNLKNTIVRAIQERKNTPAEDDNRKTFNDIKNNIIDINKNEYKVKDIFTKLSDDIKDEKKGPFKAFKEFRDSFLKEFPKTKLILNSILAVGKLQLSQGVKQVEVYKNLVNSGVNLQQTTKSLYLNANKVGLAYDEYIKVLQNNSETYSKLNGLFKNGHVVFDKMVRSAKDVTNELGLNLKTSIGISSDFLKENAFYYEMQGKSMNTLISESQKYAKSLVGLSKATGKSTESIYNEIKAREKDNLWRVLNSDPRNKGRIAAMQAAGFSQEMMEGILTGVWNKELGQASITPGFNRAIQYLMSRESNGLDGKELLKNLKGILTPYAGQINKMMEISRDNAAVTGALRNFHAFDSMFIGTNILQSNFKKGNKDDQEGFQHYANFEEQLDILNNNIALTLTPALKDLGNVVSLGTLGLKEFNKLIEPISNFLSNHPFLSMLGASVGMYLGNLFVGKIFGGMNFKNKISDKLFSKFKNYGANYGQDKLDQLIRRYNRYKRYKNIKSAWDATKKSVGNVRDNIGIWKSIKNFGIGIKNKISGIFSGKNATDIFNSIKNFGIGIKNIVLGLGNFLKNALAFKTITDIFESFYDVFNKGYDKFEEEAILRTKNRGFWERFLHPGDSLAVALSSRERQIEVLQKAEKRGNTQYDKLKSIENQNQKDKNTEKLENINNSVKTYCNVSNSPVLKSIVDINKELLTNMKMINFHVTRMSKDFIGKNLNEEDIKTFNNIFKTDYKFNNVEKYIKFIDSNTLKTIFNNSVNNETIELLKQMNKRLEIQEENNKEIRNYLHSIDINTNSSAITSKKLNDNVIRGRFFDDEF